jgi:hypothetical protein
MTKKDTRKSYPLSHTGAIAVQKTAIELSESYEHTVTKQSIIEALVFLLADRTVFNKVKKIVKKND